jgi:flagellar hook-basal body complex protein FliE
VKIGSLDTGVLSAFNLDDQAVQNVKPLGNDKQPGFIDYLKNALGEVDGLQKEASASADKLALGNEAYLHNTMIAYEKANLAMQLTIEIRNRVMEAYQEITRMQM